MSIKTEPYYFAVVVENEVLLPYTIRHRARDARLVAREYMPGVKRGWRVVKVVVSEYEPANNEALK